jgi:predicted nucleic acid-binding Zn ribbon protein
MVDGLFTTSDVARTLDVCDGAVRRAIRKGRLTPAAAIRKNRQHLFSSDELDRYIREHWARSPLVCTVCGVRFIAKAGSPLGNRYCSSSCATTARLRVERGGTPRFGVPKRACLYCGTVYAPARSDQKYCRMRCRVYAWLDRQQAQRVYK